MFPGDLQWLGFDGSNSGRRESKNLKVRDASHKSLLNLGYFFIQWIESSGAPEFKLEYTIFRTQKGFRAMGKIAQDLDTFRMPVDLKIETEGNPEPKRIEVMGTSSEFSVDTFGKPKAILLDPDNRYHAQAMVGFHSLARKEDY
jgi:aminopeptidase N